MPCPISQGLTVSVGRPVLVQLDDGGGVLQQEAAGAAGVGHDGHADAPPVAAFLLAAPALPLVLPADGLRAPLDALLQTRNWSGVTRLPHAGLADALGVLQPELHRVHAALLGGHVDRPAAG